MGIEVKGLDKLLGYIDKYGSEKVHTLILDRFNKVGLNFIRNARATNTYKDQTTQLRNSIGYIVAYRGSIITSNFDTDGVEGVGSSEGRDKGELFARELSEGINQYVLICVAGANYSAYVEAKGYDVISGSELKSIVELEKIFG